MTKPMLAVFAAALLAAPLAAQQTPPAAPAPQARAGQMLRERPQVPELTPEQRTKLRAIQDRHRDAMRKLADERTAANRKLEDDLRGVLTPEQFRLMRGRMMMQRGERGDRAERGARGEGRRTPLAGQMRRGPNAPPPPQPE